MGSPHPRRFHAAKTSPPRSQVAGVQQHTPPEREEVHCPAKTQRKCGKRERRLSRNRSEGCPLLSLSLGVYVWRHKATTTPNHKRIKNHDQESAAATHRPLSRNQRSQFVVSNIKRKTKRERERKKDRQEKKREESVDIREREAGAGRESTREAPVQFVDEKKKEREVTSKTKRKGRAHRRAVKSEDQQDSEKTQEMESDVERRKGAAAGGGEEASDNQNTRHTHTHKEK